MRSRRANQAARFAGALWVVVCLGVAVMVWVGGPLTAYADPGDLDPTFSTDGWLTSDFSGSIDRADGVAIQPDGKIVAAGKAFVIGSDDFAVARYNTNGTLDTGFGGDGLVTTDFAAGIDLGYDVAIQADGKIVVGGWTMIAAGNFDFGAARYNTDGTLDTTFDTDGMVSTDFYGYSDPARSYSRTFSRVPPSTTSSSVSPTWK